MRELGQYEFRSGHKYFWLCPFHPEKTASFCVYDLPGNEHYHCYGSGCGAHGDVIEFIRVLHKLSYREAFAQLKIQPMSDAERKALAVVRARREEEAKVKRLATLKMFQANRWHEKYHEALWFSDKGKSIGQRYLDERGVTADQADEYCLGFCEDAPWGPSITIPWGRKSSAGVWEIHDIQYRCIPGSPRVRYFWDWRKPYKGFMGRLYRDWKLSDEDPIWIVEGAFKSLALERINLNVTAIVSAQAWNQSWAPLFKGRHVAVCLDPDAYIESIELAQDILMEGGFARVIDVWQKPDDWIEEGAGYREFQEIYRQGRAPLLRERSRT
jgi:hypothetical protein